MLGRVDIHRVARTDPTRCIIAEKLVSVLSYRVAMRRNSLILQKKFSTRWRHLYISKSQGIVVTRLALGGITAAAPRSAKLTRIASLSKALSARSALKSRSVRSGATPALSCPVAGRTARERIDQRDDLGRQAAAGTPDGLIVRPAFGAGAVLMHPDDGAIDDHVLEIRIVRQGLEDPTEHAPLDPSTKALKDRVPVPGSLGKVAPRRPDTDNPENRFDEKSVVRPRAARILDFSRKKRRDPLPLIIAQYTTVQGHLLLGTLKQISADLRTLSLTHILLDRLRL
jgi:hypothetical protein